MAALTPAEFAALDLGYLSGKDLMTYCPLQLLNRVNLVMPNQPQDGCDTAYEEIESALVNRYNIKAELSKPNDDDPDTRAKLCVKIAAIIAVRNIVGSMQNASEYMEGLFKWADKTLLAIRNAQMNLPIAGVANVVDQATGKTLYNPGDEALLVCSSFKYLG
jgi:hypothetical protein